MLRSIIDGHVVLLDANEQGVKVQVFPYPRSVDGDFRKVAMLSPMPGYEHFLGGVPVNPLAVIEKVREAIEGFKAADERAKINRAVAEEVAQALGGNWDRE